MRTKVTLVLLFLNAALFLFIFRFERSWRTNEAALETRRFVLTTEAADIRSIEVAGSASFRLERRSEGWTLTQPYEWPANPNAVSRMTNDLKFLESEVSFNVADVLKNHLSLAEYGLDHPRLTVTFASGGPDTTGRPPVTTTLRVGDASKDGQSLYLLSSDGARIYVVGRELADSLQPPLDQLRSDDVMTIQVFEARLLSLQTRSAPGLHVRLRLDGSRWSFESPIPARADKAATERVINALDSLRVKRFIGPNPALALPSADPAVSATIEGDNRRETLFLGSAVDPGAPAGAAEREYYAQLDGRSALFTVMVPAGPDGLLETLNNAQVDLRDRHVLDFDPDAVANIILSAPNQPDLTLQRLEASGGSAGAPAWQIVVRGDSGHGPRTLPADSAAVELLLGQLAGLTAKSPGGFVSDAPEEADLENWGFNQPARVVTLDLAAPSSGAQIVLQVGQGTQRNRPVYARLSNGPSVYEIDPAILEETPVTPAAWRNRQLAFLPAAAQVTGLTLTDRLDHRVLLAWKAGTPAPAGVQALLEGLRGLRAQSFVQDSFADSVRDPGGEDRPWRYQLDAAIALPSGAGGEQAGTRTLLFTERVGGSQQFAGSADLNAIFALEQPMIDALWKLIYGDRDPGARK